MVLARFPSAGKTALIYDIGSNSGSNRSDGLTHVVTLVIAMTSEKHTATAMPDLSTVKVLVTGASGFLGLHCVKTLLDTGYSVRGTVRSVSNAQKVQPVKDVDKHGRLELVEADLKQPNSWKAAVKGVDYILHVASPFPPPGTVDDSIITTAVEGVLHVFKAAAASDSTVKRIVLTSSVVAIAEGHKYDPKQVLTEKDWTDVTSSHTGSYEKSKTLAERAAWDFVRDNKGHQFELAVVNPGFIVGPLLSAVEGGTSATIITRFLLNQMPAVPRLNMPCIDVRDCAKAHVRAMTAPEAAGHRHICANQPSYWMTDLATDLAAEFRPLGYPVPTRQIPQMVACFLGIFMKDAKAVAPRINQIISLDNSRVSEG
uniref:NAD-dependent epimerase/dehydratase domain-containing protein n=1 Tax=Plectus sambesii TaxID=2011161 RepID=A0A914XH83_9BILA